MAEPWWNLPRSLLAAQDRSAPEDQRDNETCATLVKPWWNLPQNLLAVQDGSAPEDQRHHETCATLVEPWWNLGGTFHRTFWQPKTDLPQKTRDTMKLAQPWWNLGETLVEPWRNLPQNLLAAQDGSAPENHRESESNSAPKPLLWLKTPKLLLLGKKAEVDAAEYPPLLQIRHSSLKLGVTK